jgi:3-keto-disaccharide hydrolase
VLVRASTPRALGIWPKSIEVQLFKGNAGDLWVIGTELDVPDDATRKEGRRHKNLTDGSEKSIGEWNRMEITCKGDTIRVKVNGELVNEAMNCRVTRGAIGRQSEEAPIEFHDIVLTPVEREHP